MKLDEKEKDLLVDIIHATNTYLSKNDFELTGARVYCDDAYYALSYDEISFIVIHIDDACPTAHDLHKHVSEHIKEKFNLDRVEVFSHW